MSATVTSIKSFLKRTINRPMSDAEFARAHIADELKSRCSRERIAQAQARYDRSVAAGVRREEALRRAISFGLNAVENDFRPRPPLDAA